MFKKNKKRKRQRKQRIKTNNKENYKTKLSYNKLNYIICIYNTISPPRSGPRRRCARCAGGRPYFVGCNGSSNSNLIVIVIVIVIVVVVVVNSK